MPESAFERLTDRLARLPGIGRRSSERIAFYLLKATSREAFELADALRAFKTNLKVCSICGNVTETDPCPICGDPERDGSIVLVVEQPSDIAAIEQAGAYRGLYHVLMGRLAPLDDVGPGELNIDGLLRRVGRDPVGEVVIGTNPTFEGDGTALYLTQRLHAAGVRVSRLARGLPVGSSLDVLSKAVLSDAIKGRQPLD